MLHNRLDLLAVGFLTTLVVIGLVLLTSFAFGVIAWVIVGIWNLIFPESTLILSFWQYMGIGLILALIRAVIFNK